MASNDLLVTWLKDAYAMEKALIPVLENHAKDAEGHPEVRERDLEHLEETRRHAEIVEQCLERLGHTPSAAKAALGGLVGRMQAMSTEPFEDEIMKNFIADYAAEQFEIACYRAIIAAARVSREEEIASMCEQILADEERMAAWLDEKMPEVAQGALAKSDAH